MKLKLLVVTYNAAIEASPVIASALLNQLLSSDVLVSDNSTKIEFKQLNQVYCEQHGLIYIDNHGNVGLSRAYNHAIEILRSEDYDALVLFDQDTEVPVNYFSTVVQSLNDYPEVMIHAPYVESPYVYISPKKFVGNKIVRWDATNDLPQVDLACINSGLVLRKELFDIVGGYEPTLFLDFVDYEFFQRVRNYHLTVKVLNVRLNQHFSGDNYSTLEGDLHRYAIYVKDLRRYAAIHHVSKLYINYFLALRCGALTKHYRILKPSLLFFGISKKGN